MAQEPHLWGKRLIHRWSEVRKQDSAPVTKSEQHPSLSRLTHASSSQSAGSIPLKTKLMYAFIARSGNRYFVSQR